MLKPVLPLEFALGVVRRSFWGDEQLGDGKSEWEGGREGEEASGRERGRRSKELGIGKDLPIPPSQKHA